jgi:signal transduction histidine kinase
MPDVQINKSQGNILIVDDKPNNLHLLSSMLDEQGYEVRCANSGAMALIAVNAEHPDLILLDINMPYMNGYQVCERLKLDQHTREIPVIFLSALSEAIDKVRAFQLGGVDYIIKPFQLEEVLARIENQLSLRRMQIELQKAKAEALIALEREQELNRLRSEFVAMVSHDFRTPLTSIQGFAGLLECGDQIPSLEIINRYVDKINLAVGYLLSLLDEILLIGSIESGKMELDLVSVNLTEFCDQLIDSLKYTAGNQHRILFNCSATSNQAIVDPKLLQKILTNLLTNSIKYSAHESEVYLDLDLSPQQVLFCIKDQGIGIPAANQAHLFEPFYRSTNVGDIKGTGLGLAVVKKCVEVHQGSISLISQEGVGTTVTVSLPRYSEIKSEIQSKMP